MGAMEDSTRDVEVLLGEPRRAILSMFVPVFIALLIGQVNTFVDTVWCSMLGIEALSAIAMVSSIYYVLIGIGNGIGIGANVAISRRIGAGDREGASRCASQTMVVMLAVSLPIIPLFLVFIDPVIIAMGGEDVMSESREYLLPMVLLCSFSILNGIISGCLRGEGAARLSTMINCAGAFANMVLDPVLIFGLDLGLTGASAATMMSTVLSVCLGLAVYRSDMTFLRPHLCRPETEILSDVFHVGVPQMMELTVMGLMNLFLVRFVIACGGTDGLAIYSTPWSMISLTIVPITALASAMVPVCSSAIGQGDPGRLRSAYGFTVRTAVAAGSLMTVLILLFADLVMYMFTFGGGMAEHHDAMVHVVRIYAWFMPCYGLIYVGSSMLSALGKSGYALMSSFLRNVMLICIYYIASFHTMEWIYWGLTLGEIAGGLFMIALAQWQFRRRYRSMASSPSSPAI